MVNKPKINKNDKLLAKLEGAEIGGRETRSHDEWVEWQKNNQKDGNWTTGPRRW